MLHEQEEEEAERRPDERIAPEVLPDALARVVRRLVGVALGEAEDDLRQEDGDVTGLTEPEQIRDEARQGIDQCG